MDLVFAALAIKLKNGCWAATQIRESLASCLAFYATVAAEEIAGVSKNLFGSLKTYPLDGLPQLWQMVFTCFVPVGLAVWFPSRVLIMMVSE